MASCVSSNPKNRKTIAALKETKGLLQLLSNSSADFGEGVPLPPYVDPIRPKVTQVDPRL
jgi:hypothetical protein